MAAKPPDTRSSGGEIRGGTVAAAEGATRGSVRS